MKDGERSRDDFQLINVPRSGAAHAVCIADKGVVIFLSYCSIRGERHRPYAQQQPSGDICRPLRFVMCVVPSRLWARHGPSSGLWIGGGCVMSYSIMTKAMECLGFCLTILTYGH